MIKSEIQSNKDPRHNSKFYLFPCLQSFDKILLFVQYFRMSWKGKAREALLKCDIFSTSEFLRYNEEPEYRTMTGAVCSVITVVTFCAIFMNVMISTFAKTEIVWSLNTIDAGLDQFDLQTQIQNKNKFMFAISVSDSSSIIDLNNDTQRMFDVAFLLKTKNNTTTQQDQQIPLQPCSLNHWNINNQFVEMYQRMKFQYMLCPPIGRSIPIQGKFTSKIFQYAEIRILKCNASTNSSKTCANDSRLINKTFTYNLYILNSLINPSSPNYLSYYLEDRNYVQFTTTFTSLINIYVSNYQITTDEGIMPKKEERQQEGAIINSLGQIIPRQSDGINFANIIIRRSSTTLLVNRSFQKIDETLSYIGGLFGFVMVALLFMRQYTEYSYEVDASEYLYREDHQQQANLFNFNFLIFLGYAFYLFLGLFGIKPGWKTMQRIDDNRQQIQKQFDVRFLFERINFIQKALNHLFNDSQSQFLYLLKRPSLKQASKLRENYQFKGKVLEKIVKGGKKQIQNELQKTEDNIELPNNQISLNKVHPLLFQSSQVMQNENMPQKRQDQDVVFKLKDHFRFLHKRTLKGDHTSKKIIQDIDPHIVKIFQSQNEVSIKSEETENVRHKNEKSQRQTLNNARSKKIEITDLVDQNTMEVNLKNLSKEASGGKDFDFQLGN